MNERKAVRLVQDIEQSFSKSDSCDHHPCLSCSWVFFPLNKGRQYPLCAKHDVLPKTHGNSGDTVRCIACPLRTYSFTGNAEAALRVGR